MENLNHYLKQARDGSYAIGHFNFSTGDVLKSIIEGAKEAGAPAVMVGTSEGEAEFVGMKEAVALVKALREEMAFPVFLNADHFKSFEKCKEAIDAGYDSVLIDGSKMSLEENIALTKRTVEFARSVNADISVEGELGYLKGSSEVQTKIEISSEDYTKPEEAKRFAEETGADRMAVVFGNIHGIVTEQEEKLDIEHFKKITTMVLDAYFVLHGASGLKDADVADAIKAGIVNVHFNTELRVAYREALDKELHEKEGEAAPYKYLEQANEEVKKVVVAKTNLFLGKSY